jgi:Holliday junction resolvasome RuvABC endonuclease subunit
MVITGLDIALRNTGVTVIDTEADIKNRIEHHTLKVSTKDLSDFHRQMLMCKHLVPYIRNSDCVVLENFGEAGSHSSFSGALVPRIELQGMIRLLSYWKKGVECLSVVPRKLRAFGFGKSECTKTQLKNAVRLLWRLPVANDHEADSAVLAVIGLGLKAWVDNQPIERFCFEHNYGRIMFTKKQIKMIQTSA